jgi:hypothetical protein
MERSGTPCMNEYARWESSLYSIVDICIVMCSARMPAFGTCFQRTHLVSPTLTETNFNHPIQRLGWQKKKAIGADTSHASRTIDSLTGPDVPSAASSGCDRVRAKDSLARIRREIDEKMTDR